MIAPVTRTAATRPGLDAAPTDAFWEDVPREVPVSAGAAAGPVFRSRRTGAPPPFAPSDPEQNEFGGALVVWVLGAALATLLLGSGLILRWVL
jgi:hypothetical protein